MNVTIEISDPTNFRAIQELHHELLSDDKLHELTINGRVLGVRLKVMRITQSFGVPGQPVKDSIEIHFTQQPTEPVTT